MVRVLRSIGSGVVATAVMMGTFLFMQAQTRSRLGAPEAIASYVGLPDRANLGIALFVAIGVLVWPVVFAFVHGRLPDAVADVDAGVLGLGFGAVLWVFFLLLSSGGPQWPFVLLYLAFTLIAHLAYGYTLGLAYQWSASA